MKEQKYHLYLSDDEYRRVLQSLIRLKNSLTARGRYTDAVDGAVKNYAQNCLQALAE